ncbi:MAG: glycogen/starch synthase [Candidatus Komeilibacteria bacterium]
MANKELTIVSVTSELDPYFKIGGLGDVARALPKSLQRLKQHVSIFTPYYKLRLDEKKYPVKKIIDSASIVIDDSFLIKASLYQAELAHKLPVYFVSIDRFFGRSKKVYYGSSTDSIRYFAFNIAVLEFIRLLKLQPDIIQCHDWPAGLIPELLKKRYKNDPLLKSAASVFTIHNLSYQLGQAWWSIPVTKRDNGRTPLPLFSNTAGVKRINFTKRAILYADAINAVSEAYREEIMQPHFGQDLHRILRNRENKLYGVVNGIDYHEFNPANDPNLKTQYNYTTIEKKLENKRALQKRCGLKISNDTPIMVMSSRIIEQKGFDLFLPLLPYLLHKDVEIIILGEGDKKYTEHFQALAKANPTQLSLFSFDKYSALETLMYAGGDILLLPSRFEPCGTNQLKALRYGCVPLVREVGGLGETVTNYDPKTNPDGIGFVFNAYSSHTLMFTIARALETYKYPDIWRQLMVRGMKVSFSWDLPARKYLKLFHLALKFKQKETTNGN